MHLQIRTVPARSPADLDAFLAILADNNINMESVGGSNIEAGGEFYFSVAHDTEAEVMAVLEQEGYVPRLVEVETCRVSNDPGQLLDCIREIRSRNEAAGRVIMDITVGAPDVDGLIPVQIYSDTAP